MRILHAVLMCCIGFKKLKASIPPASRGGGCEVSPNMSDPPSPRQHASGESHVERTSESGHRASTTTQTKRPSEHKPTSHKNTGKKSPEHRHKLLRTQTTQNDPRGGHP